jgi:hypothetical protein
VLTERESLLNLIFNLTSKLTDKELKILKTFVNYGQLSYGNGGSNGYHSLEPDFENDYRKDHTNVYRYT